MSTVETRRVTASDLAAAAKELRRDLDAGIPGEDLLRSRLAELVARDGDGRWWSVSPRTGWSRWTGSAWQAEAAPAGWLEAISALDVRRPRAARRPPEPEPHAPDRAAGAADLIAEAAVRALQAFERGELTSLQAEREAAALVLVDRTGRAWRHAPRSRRWFAWEDGSWQAESAPPPPDSLLTRDEIAATAGGAAPCAACGVVSPAGRFCPACGAAREAPADGGRIVAQLLSLAREGHERFPERIARDWDPPASPTLATSRCAACGCADVGPCPRCPRGEISARPAPEQCARCGRPLVRGKSFCGGCGVAARAREE